MALLGIPYHCSTIRRGDGYRELYESVIDAGDDYEQEAQDANAQRNRPERRVTHTDSSYHEWS
jgi:hypothetical protein